MTRMQADGGERTTLRQVEVAYLSARAEARGMSVFRLRWQCRSLARKATHTDQIALVAVVALKATQDELRHRGQPVPT